MPYIKPEGRDALDPLIEKIANEIKFNDGPGLGDMAGALNYVCYRLALRLMGPPKYWKVALIAGVFSNIASEFYRRVAVPYEEAKIKENGDIETP